jgi:hypothetical protein
MFPLEGEKFEARGQTFDPLPQTFEALPQTTESNAEIFHCFNSAGLYFDPINSKSQLFRVFPDARMLFVGFRR